MNKWVENVRDFHRRFGCFLPQQPTNLSLENTDLQTTLQNNEHEELIEALDEGDLAQTVAECIDNIYVSIGTILTLGVDPEKMWDAIHRANMLKMKNPLGNILLKPPGFVPVDPHKILEQELKIANGLT